MVEAMARHARVLPGLLPGFAVPAAAAWTTGPQGGNALAYGPGTRIDEHAIEAAFRELPDACSLVLDLDLVVTCADGVTEAAVSDGASVLVEIMDRRLFLDVRLNVDLHAECTRGDDRDNTALARLNASRLAAFLARLRKATGAKFDAVHAGDRVHRNQMSQYGFFQWLRDFDLADVLEALDMGRPFRFTDRPEDLRQYVPTEELVWIFRMESGDFCIQTEFIFHDGSAMSATVNHYTDDVTEVAERITALRDRGLSMELW